MVFCVISCKKRYQRCDKSVWKNVYEHAWNNNNRFIVLNVQIRICCLIQDLRNSMNERNTLFFIKIYLSFYSRKGPTACCQLRDRWRVIYPERGLLPKSSSGRQGVPTLATSFKIVRDDLTLRSTVCPSLDCDSQQSQFKSDRVVLIVVSFRLHTCCT